MSDEAVQQPLGLSVLLEVSASLAATLDLDKVLQASVDGVTRLVGLDTAAVYLLNGEMLRLGATAPPVPPGFPEELRLARLADHPHIQAAVSSGEPLLVPDCSAEELTATERVAVEQRDLRTLLYVPVAADARVMGVFIVGSAGVPKPPSAAEIELSRALANLAALALRNAQLYEERRGYVEQLQQTLAQREQAEQEHASLQARLAQAQRVDSIGRLAGGIAHDLNNLLSPILGYGDMLMDDFDPRDARRELVEEILVAGTRARDLVGQLLAYGRKQILSYRATSLDDAVTGLERLLRRTIPEDIALEVCPGAGSLAVMADVSQIERVIINLAVNAADAMLQGGRLTIRTAALELDAEAAAARQVAPGEYVVLAISDTGTGMDAETLEHMFEPFYTNKGERGTGLGLSTVYGIVRQHGGDVRVESELGRGTTMEVFLPVWRGEAAAAVDDEAGAEGRAEPPLAPDAASTVLLVEDDEQVRTLSGRLLRRLGYEVLAASSGDEALEALRAHDGGVHLLLTDVVMPGLNGKELFERAAELHPGLKVLYMSGYTADTIAHRGVLEQRGAYLPKPFTAAAFAAKVREILEQ